MLINFNKFGRGIILLFVIIIGIVLLGFLVHYIVNVDNISKSIENKPFLSFKSPSIIWTFLYKKISSISLLYMVPQTTRR